MSRVVLGLLALTLLAACGIKGDLERQRLVFLQILRVRERQLLHDAVERREICADARGFRADEFSRILIALLRHDRRARGPCIAQ